MQGEISNVPAPSFDGRIRGFTLNRRWGVDYWYSKIRIFPATGVTEEGQTYSGYYPEVSGEGTMFHKGRGLDARIYEAALNNFSQVGEKRYVARIESGTYRLERDRWGKIIESSLRSGETTRIEGFDFQDSNGTVEDQSTANLNSVKDIVVRTDAGYELELIMRDGLIYEVGATVPYTGHITVSDVHGVKESERTYIGGKLNGVETIWYRNGAKSYQAYYKDNLRHGPMTFWGRGGSITSQVCYEDGVLVNLSKDKCQP